MKRDFDLPEEDVLFLNKLGLPWETIVAGEKWVVIHDYLVPKGYTVNQVKIGLKIDASYPETQIDMAYFIPDLRKIAGGAIGALTSHTFDGLLWQRWSRHRTGKNPWRPGIDNIEMHLGLVRNWLEREIK